jgi:hypothetical protein
MLDKIKKQLKPKDVKYFKLAVWTAIMVWVVSFITISFFVSLSLDTLGQELFDGTLGFFTGKLWAISYTMTVFYIIYLMLRWVNRKLRS